MFLFLPSMQTSTVSLCVNVCPSCLRFSSGVWQCLYRLRSGGHNLPNAFAQKNPYILSYLK